MWAIGQIIEAHVLAHGLEPVEFGLSAFVPSLLFYERFSN